MRWIRWVLVALLLTVGGTAVKAQTFSEWFRQKKTQKRYLIEQLVALKVYAGYVHKGYGIVSDGWQTVRDITNGEFNLHDLFISGLKKVSPAIRNDVRIAEILVLQADMLKSFGGMLTSDGFSGAQLDYLLTVRSAVNSEGLDDLEELLLAITSGRAEMTDDERLERLNAIYARTLERSAFVHDFSAKASRLLKQKKIEQRDIEQLRRYYEDR